MTSPVIVYPNSLDATPSEPDERRMADAGDVVERGERVRWYYTTSRHEPDCAYCKDGRCEQRVEWTVRSSRDVVVHDRPRWVQ
jgi:hypothetical protein